jgi:Neurotransmitter-gated ion-channel ligand binding domain
MLLLLVAALAWLPFVAWGQEPSLPPGERPIRVASGFFLTNLSGMAERSETFDADLYLSFRWHDPRLAFAGSEPKRFLEDAAVERLKTMWWPQLEFVNTAEPHITNRALQISPDGSVRYEIGVTSDFRSDLDLHRFPFDRQRLEVRVQSFLWRADEMVFVSDPEHLGFNPASTFEGLTVTGVATDIRRRDLAGWGEAYSEFAALVDVRREAAFYVWTVFTPVILIFLISCTVFVVHYENFGSRVGISLTALLACIATQFAMSFNLPQISYLTVIDRMFLAGYFCIALGVLVSTVQAVLLRTKPERAARLDRLAGIGLPALFVVLIALCIAC